MTYHSIKLYIRAYILLTILNCLIPFSTLAQQSTDLFVQNKLYVALKKTEYLPHLNKFGRTVKLFNDNQVKHPVLKKIYVLDCGNCQLDTLALKLNADTTHIKYAEKIPNLYDVMTLPNDYDTTNHYSYRENVLNLVNAWQFLDSNQLNTIIPAAVLDLYETPNPTPWCFDNPCKGPNCTSICGKPDCIASGHGSAVGSIMGMAICNNDTGVCGAAYNRGDIHLYRADISNFTNAINNGAKVTNHSYVNAYHMGTNTDDIIYQEARDNGVSVVAAAGNHGDAFRNDCMPYHPMYENHVATEYIFPAAHNGVISVGAITANNLRAMYATAINDAVDVVAPDLASVNFEDSKNGCVPGQGIGGTSSASPQIAGLILLMRSANPNLSSSQIEYILKLSALNRQNTQLDVYSKTGTLHNSNGIDFLNKIDYLNFRGMGYGLPNGYDAVKMAFNFNPLQKVPEAKIDYEFCNSFYNIHKGNSVRVRGISNHLEINGGTAIWRHDGKGKLVINPSNPLEATYVSSEFDYQQVVLTFEVKGSDSEISDEVRVFITLEEKPISICNSNTVQAITLNARDFNLGTTHKEGQHTFTILTPNAGSLSNSTINGNTTVYGDNWANFTPNQGFSGTVQIRYRYNPWTRNDNMEYNTFDCPNYPISKTFSFTYTINVYPEPSKSIISGKTEICYSDQNTKYNISNNINGFSYNWDLPNGMIKLSGNNTKEINVSITSNYNSGYLKVTPISPFGCAGPKDSIEVKIKNDCIFNPPPSCDRPSPIWSSYFGSNDTDEITASAITDNGDIIIYGNTSDKKQLPNNAETIINPTIGTLGNNLSSNKGGGDLFVAKIASDGSKVKWITYLGGDKHEYNGGLDIDKTSNNIYISGTTSSSTGFITSPVNNYNNGLTETFCIKLTPDGLLDWGTYIGGNDSDTASGLKITYGQNSGVILTGHTSSSDFINATNSYQGGTDIFITRIEKNSGITSWSTYFGSNCGDENLLTSNSITVDTSDHSNDYVFIAGNSSCIISSHNSSKQSNSSSNYGNTHSGGIDAIVLKVNGSPQILNDGGQIVWWDKWGREFNDSYTSICLNNNDLIVAGFSSNSNNSDILISKRNPNTGIEFKNRIFEGNDEDKALSITSGIDEIFITGLTRSNDLLLKQTAISFYRDQKTSTNNSSDIYIASINSSNLETINWHSYFGNRILNSNIVENQGISLNYNKTEKTLYFSGLSTSNTFETTQNVIQNQHSDLSDGILVKFNNPCKININGPDKVCSAYGNFVYEVENPNSNSSYHWTVPQGMNIVNGNGTYKIIVNVTSKFEPNTISVIENNSSNINPLPAVKHIGITSECCGIVNANFYVSTNAPYNFNSCDQNAKPAIINNKACSGTNLYFNPIGYGFSYSWSIDDSVVSTNSVFNTTQLSSGLHTVTLEADNNFCTVKSSQIFEIFTIPNTPIINSVNDFCSNSTQNSLLNFTISNASADLNYEWQYTGNDGNLDSYCGSSNTIRINNNTPTGGNLIATSYNILGCPSLKDTLQISPKSCCDGFNASFEISKETICSSESIDLTYTGSQNYSLIKWYLNGTEIGEGNTLNYLINTSDYMDYYAYDLNFSCKAYSESQCLDVVSKKITYTNLERNFITGPSSNICDISKNLFYSLYGANINSVTWSISNPVGDYTIKPYSNNPPQIYLDLGTAGAEFTSGSLQAIYTTNLGCKDTLYLDLNTIHCNCDDLEEKSIQIGGYPCPNSHRINANNVGIFIPNVYNVSTYKWIIKNPEGDTVFTNIGPNQGIGYTFENSGTYQVFVNMDRYSSCNVTKQLDVVVPEKIKIISGPTLICPPTSDQQITYKATNGYAYYNWWLEAAGNVVVPNGSINEAIVSFDKYYMFAEKPKLVVRGFDNQTNCYTTDTLKINVYRNIEQIWGDVFINTNKKDTIIRYETEQTSNVSNFIWNVTSPANIISGQGTKAIEVYYPKNYQGGKLTVSYNENSCSVDKEITLYKAISNPTTTGINGTNCAKPTISYYYLLDIGNQTNDIDTVIWSSSNSNDILEYYSQMGQSIKFDLSNSIRNIKATVYYKNQNISPFEYTYEVSVSNSCGDLVTNSQITSTQQGAFFPNPFNNYIESGFKSNIDIDVMDVSGRIIESINLKPNQVFGQNYASGIYMVIVKHEQSFIRYMITKK